MGRKRKLLTGITPLGGPSLKSRRAAREVTSKYHSMRNELVKVQANGNLDDDEKEMRVRELEAELEGIGGTNRYQEASIISTNHFKTSRWVISCVHALIGTPGTGSKDRKGKNNSNSEAKSIENDNDNDNDVKDDGDVLKDANTNTNTNTTISNNQRWNVLEIGAINIQLQQQRSWLNVRSIDVNSQHPTIEEIDFFDVPVNGRLVPKPRITKAQTVQSKSKLQSKNNHNNDNDDNSDDNDGDDGDDGMVYEGEYDVLVSSMVVNCVTKPTKRGEMLVKMRYHLKNDNSILLLVLPSRCIDSRHMGVSYMNANTGNGGSSGDSNSNTSTSTGRSMFIKLMESLGYVDVKLDKTTPRLLFYTMKRGPLLHLSLTTKVKENSNSNSNNHPVIKNKISISISKNENENENENEEFLWNENKNNYLLNMPKKLKKIFMKTNINNIVSPKEFAVGFDFD